MIQSFGEACLLFGIIFSLLQSMLPLVGRYRNNLYLLACARPCAWGQFFFVTAAYTLLTIGFLKNDFSIAYVAENSHSALPFMYRLTAVWGAHEGSILLWIFILNIWTIVYSLKKNDVLQPVVLAVLGIISFSFLSFLLLTSNPFLSALFPSNGHDLNPLLQDPGFVIHPPMLYTGYVGFSVAFAITQAALLNGKLDQVWAKMTRQFATAAWCFLTLGIALGSWWAYRVLGWGGFWFWDPVENASLLPWLSGTALIHVLVLVERRGVAKSWAALLAIVSFILSLLGTFLVRSGVLVSAHTFANDPARGIFLLLLLALLTTAALAVYALRLPKLSLSEAPSFSRLSREMGLLLNSALLIVAMLTILLGTLYPLILDAFHLGIISVGAPYFNMVMAPLVFLTLALMGFAAMCHWQNQTARKIWQKSWKKILISTISALGLVWYFVGQIDITAVSALSLSFWVILSILDSLRLLPGMALAHLGFAVFVLGVMLSSILNQELEIRIHPGTVVNLGPYQFFFLDTKGISGSNYRGIQATFEVAKNTLHVTTMYPEKRIYTVRDMVMTKVAIHPGIFRDLYIALGEPLDQNDWSVRIYYKPFIRWIWFGAMLMIVGGILAILQRKQPMVPNHHKNFSRECNAKV
jgi:cytochrome c-type biogenesis protein CcmF